MVITHHGGQCFKVSFGTITIAFDPISKQSKLPSVKFGADAAFVSLWHSNFNGVDAVTHGSKAPFVADGPGEYEIGQVTARGFGVATTYAGQPAYNTIYAVTLEDIHMVFLGALAEPELDSKILAELGDIDILFVPIGGGDVLEVPQAAKLAVKLEAKLIIPMHYDAPSLAAFLKEVGSTTKPTDKLTIKKKDVLAMSGEVVILTP
jgi:L-ascorbate metabolism protein UlaG (beta-lactamase superfamily)